MKTVTLLVSLLATCAVSDSASISQGEVVSSLRYILLDRHGGALSLPRYAERLERERGFSQSEMKELLLEIAEDESWDVFARANAIGGFISMARPEELSRLDPFCSSTNDLLRQHMHSVVIGEQLAVPVKLAYAREKIDWLAGPPDFQHDAFHIMVAFYSQMTASDVSDDDKAKIVSFFRDEARDCRFGENAYSVFSFLNRHDPSWKTNECRVELLRRWRDDPSLPEDVRNFMRATSTNSLVSSETTDARGVRTEEISPSSAESPTISRNTDSLAKVSSPDGYRPVAMASSRLARIVGVAALLAVALVLVFRRSRR